MIRQVYDVLKKESGKGDFNNLVQKDLNEINLKMSDEEIQTFSNGNWKTIVKQNVKQAAFQHLLSENSSKEKTKNIVFDQFEMRKYLFINRSQSLSKVIFAVRSGTLEIKEWTPWKYDDNICVKCESAAETMSHFAICKSYSIDTLVNGWENIYQDNPDIQYDIARK